MKRKAVAITPSKTANTAVPIAVMRTNVRNPKEIANDMGREWGGESRYRSTYDTWLEKCYWA